MTPCPECGAPISALVRLLTGPVPCGACRSKALDRQWLARDAELLRARKARQQAMRAYLAEKYPEEVGPARQGKASPAPSPANAFRRAVADLLVTQLGHQRAEANALIAEALAAHPEIRTEDELFQACYQRGRK